MRSHLCLFLIALKSLTVLMEANEESDEAKLLLLILEQFERRKLNERSHSYLRCKRCRDTQRISRRIFHKAQVFSGHLRVFLTSAVYLPLTCLLLHHHNPRRRKK